MIKTAFLSKSTCKLWGRDSPCHWHSFTERMLDNLKHRRCELPEHQSNFAKLDISCVWPNFTKLTLVCFSVIHDVTMLFDQLLILTVLLERERKWERCVATAVFILITWHRGSQSYKSDLFLSPWGIPHLSSDSEIWSQGHFMRGAHKRSIRTKLTSLTVAVTMTNFGAFKNTGARYWISFPVLYSRSLLLIYLMYGSVYLLIPSFEFW